MKKIRTYTLNLALLITASMIFANAINAYAQTERENRTLEGTGRTIENVRIEVLSVDESTSVGTVRFVGEGCQYCDDVYRINEATQLYTLDYKGSLDFEILADHRFVRGSARIILSDKMVLEVRYVDVAE